MADDVPLLAMSAQDTLQQNPRTDRIKDNLESGLGGLHGNVETYTKNKGIFSNAPFQGWKFSAFVAFVTSVIVLCFNVGFLLYSTTHHQDEVLYEGNCDKVHRLSVVFHLLINALSTALLGASNFGMQCLAAPTRQVIDRAHKKQQWLDIGVPSVHNLFRVSVTRSLLWLCLVCSSLPLHLMYNSAIYTTTAATAYDVFAGPDSLAQRSTEEISANNKTMGWSSQVYSAFEQLYGAAKNDTLVRLDNNDCLDAFAQTYQTTYSMAWVVSNSTTNGTYALVYTNPVYQPSVHNVDGVPGTYDWLCPVGALGSTCNSGTLSEIRSEIARNDWSVGNQLASQRYTVDYCMAMKMPQDCKLQYSFPLTMTVIAFNIAKAIVLLSLWLGLPDIPILTIGDAIASFLRREDAYTRNACLLTAAEARLADRYAHAPAHKPIIHGPKVFDHKRRRWSSAASGGRWAFGVIFWLIAIIVCISLLAFGVKEVSNNGSDLSAWAIQFGAVSAYTLITGDSWPTSLLSNVIIANTPQLIFSFLYFGFNGILTSMRVAVEWSNYAGKRKPLRVSNNPQLAQRSNHFLSIPYRYAIPLMVTSGMMHWLISESLFMVGIEAWDENMQRDPSSDIITCGYSPRAMLSTICVGVLMFGGLVGLAMRRLPSAMPVAASCSLAIAAACHPRYDPNKGQRPGGDDEDVEMDSERGDEEDMGCLPVQWVAVHVDGPIGHCSFTSDDHDVGMPEGGHEYQ